MDDIICTLALKKIKGLQNKHIFLLSDYFKNLCEVFNAGSRELSNAGLKPDYVKILGNERVVKTAFYDAIKEIEEASDSGVRIITWNSPLYPANLNLIKNKPPVLYYKGTLKENLKFAAAIVGQRTPPDYALKLAGNLATELCLAGFAIVSGLAAGIDTAAHAAAIARNRYTLAYIGSGLLEPVYPHENTGLYNDIINGDGAIVSELPLHEKISSANLVARDRLQSGTSLGVFAVSSPAKGGTMKTCGFSIKQKRPVFIPEYPMTIMDSADNAGIKSLFGSVGVTGLKLGKDYSFNLAEVFGEMKVVYDAVYGDCGNDDGYAQAQPGLFDRPSDDDAMQSLIEN